MIQLSRNYSLPEREEQIIPIKVIAVGSAGSNALDRVVLDGMDKSDLIAANTDVQSLASSVAAVKVQLGRSVTRGLGTGGDPELGFDAAQEAADEIREALTQARLIFICAGLGGGTGSGASPVVAQIARDMGALVIAFATVPFSFEGKRRAAQARDALARLHETTDAVVCFENDRMADMVAPKAGIHQAFAVADSTISQSLRSIVNLIQRPGIMRIGFDDLLAALRGGGGRCLFGFGESDSDNRAHQALAQALKNPLMDRGRMLADASSVLVQVTGGPGMTLSEVEILMRELNKHIGEETQLLFGTAVDGRMGDRLSVTLLSSLPVETVAGVVDAVRPSGSDPGSPTPATTTHRPRKAKGQSQPPPPLPEPVFEAPTEPIMETLPEPTIVQFVEPEPTELPPAIEPESVMPVFQDEEIPQPEPVTEEISSVYELPEEPRLIEAQMEPDIVSAPQPPTPRIIPPKKKPLIAPKVEPENPKHEKPAAARQEVLQFEPLTRGRFEKSEPTIVEGQDLDVPTFLRKNIRVK
jgi:cell division protein FtsZ